MAGEHSKRRGTPARSPERRRPGIELVDARTRVEHQVSPDELLTGHQPPRWARCSTDQRLRAALAGLAAAAARLTGAGLR